MGEELIKEYHKLLKSATTDDRVKHWFNVGEYKKLENLVGDMATSKPDDVKKDMTKLLKEYHSISKITLENIVDFHVKFESIHPFQDGNGRIGRMIMFRETLKHSVIPFIIDEKHKQYYYRGIMKYRNGEKKWLLDTIRCGQDDFVKMCNDLLEGWK